MKLLTGDSQGRSWSWAVKMVSRSRGCMNKTRGEGSSYHMEIRGGDRHVLCLDMLRDQVVIPPGEAAQR